MERWLPDLPKPPDFAREVIDAISHREPDIPHRAERAIREIDALIVRINEVFGEAVGKLHQDRQLIQQLAYRFGAEPEPMALPKAVVEAGHLDQQSNGNGGAAESGGLTAHEKRVINEDIERLMKLSPTFENEQIVETILSRHGATLSRAVSQPRPTVGSMVYRVRRRLDRQGALVTVSTGGLPVLEGDLGVLPPDTTGTGWRSLDGDPEA